jgi:hypothetical protein
LPEHASYCHHQATKTFDELKLPAEMIFVHVPQYRPFVCSKCGGGIVKVMPIFPEKCGSGSYFSPGIRSRPSHFSAFC